MQTYIFNLTPANSINTQIHKKNVQQLNCTGAKETVKVIVKVFKSIASLLKKKERKSFILVLSNKKTITTNETKTKKGGARLDIFVQK